MRIAFIGQKGIPTRNGGVERYVESLAVNLAASGQEVLVYNRRGYLSSPLKEFRGIRIISLPYINNKNLANITHTFLACLDVLKRKVDVIHFQGVGPALLCWLPKLLAPRLKIIGTLHSFDYYNDKWSPFAKFMLKAGEKSMCRWADEIIVLTEATGDYVKKAYGRVALVIPNGADLYTEMGDAKIIPWELKRDEYILSVCRLIKLKGLQYLMAAFKNTKTDKKLVIVGEGEYLPELEKIAAGDERIIFTGNQTGETLDQLYANTYLFVQASEMEGLSISLLEAMAHKSACLVSDIEGNREAIGNTGVTFSNKNIQDLQTKLENLLADPGLVANNAAAAYERAKEKFSWQDVTKQVLAAYTK